MILDNFGNLLEFLADNPEQHARSTSFYRFLEQLTNSAFHEAENKFRQSEQVTLAELGPIRLPYEKMGAIDSIDLFGLDELLMFSFYYRNRGRYARAVDIGANIGLHSIVLSLCGCTVDSYEPDPVHYAKLTHNLKLNNIKSYTVHQSAVSDKCGSMEFVRVLGNTTSSHLAGAKANPYGELERFAVAVEDIRKIVLNTDFLKIDAEGHEAVLLTAIPVDAWEHLDAFVEIGTPENAKTVYEKFYGTDVNIFTQKRSWNRVCSVEDMPSSYKEGSVFISSNTKMPW